MAYAHKPHGKAHGGYALGEPHSMHNAISSWFIGPQAENQDRLTKYFELAAQYQSLARQSFHPEDGVSISPSTLAGSTPKAAHVIALAIHHRDDHRV